MQKIDIARRIHQQAGISETEAATLLDWILELLKATLRKGDPIMILGFGTFKIRSKSSRTGRNPSTGEPLIISARRVVTFRPSPQLTTEMNSLKAEPQEAVTRTG